MILVDLGELLRSYLVILGAPALKLAVFKQKINYLFTKTQQKYPKHYLSMREIVCETYLSHFYGYKSQFSAKKGLKNGQHNFFSKN